MFRTNKKYFSLLAIIFTIHCGSVSQNPTQAPELVQDPIAPTVASQDDLGDETLSPEAILDPIMVEGGTDVGNGIAPPLNAHSVQAFQEWMIGSGFVAHITGQEGAADPIVSEVCGAQTEDGDVYCTSNVIDGGFDLRIPIDPRRANTMILWTMAPGYEGGIGINSIHLTLRNAEGMDR